jgi:hypothetical protein
MQIALPAVNWRKTEIGSQMLFCEPHIGLNVVLAPRQQRDVLSQAMLRSSCLAEPTEAAHKGSADPFWEGIMPLDRN